MCMFGLFLIFQNLSALDVKSLSMVELWVGFLLSMKGCQVYVSSVVV